MKYFLSFNTSSSIKSYSPKRARWKSGDKQIKHELGKKKNHELVFRI